MSQEFASMITDIILCAGTFLLGVKVKTSKAPHTWRTFFFALAAAAGLGALYHGIERFHVPTFWVLVSAATMCSSFLFLAACACLSRPTWRWLGWMWPLVGFLGVITGTLLSSQPFFILAVVSTVLIFISLYILQGAPSKECRQWIMLGIGITILGFVVQKVTNFDGLFSHNALFHEFQLLGNYFIWLGVKKS